MATVNIGSLKFNWKGAYNGSTAYAIDDVTEYNGRLTFAYWQVQVTFQLILRTFNQWQQKVLTVLTLAQH